jgi:hypothetical protein
MASLSLVPCSCNFRCESSLRCMYSVRWNWPDSIFPCRFRLRRTGPKLGLGLWDEFLTRPKPQYTGLLSWARSLSSAWFGRPHGATPRRQRPLRLLQNHRRLPPNELSVAVARCRPPATTNVAVLPRVPYTPHDRTTRPLSVSCFGCDSPVAITICNSVWWVAPIPTPNLSALLHCHGFSGWDPGLILRRSNEQEPLTNQWSPG